MTNTLTPIIHTLIADGPQPLGPISVPFTSAHNLVLREYSLVSFDLKADDIGTLSVFDAMGNLVAYVRAELQEGDWQLKSDDTYWQNADYALLPPGTYHFAGTLFNKANGSPYAFYRMRISGIRLAPEPVPPRREICCSCGCSCSNEDGNNTSVSSLTLSGDDVGICPSTAAAEPSDTPWPASAETEGESAVIPLGLKRRSLWDWEASLSGMHLSIDTGEGQPLLFLLQSGASVAEPAGSSTNLNYRIELRTAAGELCPPETSPASYVLCDASGSRLTFSAETGRVVRATAADGRVQTAAQYAAAVETQYNADGSIRSCFSAKDGLQLITTEADGSLLVSYYAAANVTRRPDGTYATIGAPFRTERQRMVRDADGTTTATITRRQEGLPEHVTTRTESDGCITIIRGSGAEAVTRNYTTYECPDNTYAVIETLRRAGSETPDRCTLTVKRRTANGDIVLRETEAYQTPSARTTFYSYDSSARLTRIHRPDGSYTRYEYDAQGRVILEAEPWAGGGEKETRTTYATTRSYDTRPATITELRNGTVIRTETRRYSDSAAANRVTISVSNGEQTQTRIEESYGEQPAYAYAAGKPKFRQEVNGVQTFYEYTATALHGAAHLLTTTTCVNGELVAGQSRRTEQFIAANEDITHETESIRGGSAWLPLSSASYEYDAQHRRTRTTRGNGRSSSTEYMCCGVLSETDEDGIRTDYAYDSALQLTETTRAAVYDGEVCITPEIITEYTRDAAGRVLTTTRRIGALTTTESTAYDALGRVVSRTDTLGRTTTTAYSEDGLTTTLTTPAGATLITTRHTDGSTASLGGTGQCETHYLYDLNNSSIRETVCLADSETILSQTLTNGFGQTVVQAQPNTLGGFIYTRSEYNSLGQLTQQSVDGQAPVVYAYDAMGNVCRQTVLLDAAVPEDATKNRILTRAVAAVQEADGVYQVVTTARNNAAGTMLGSTEKTLLSESATQESKTVSVDERGNTSTSWSEYGTGAARTQYSTIPGSALTAQAVSVDGFTTSQVDHAGITSSATRRYTASGIEYTQTDGRGNTTTTVTDIAGRTISVTDAAGNTTTTAYGACCDAPALITDALGHTTCYRYDERGRKVAEWGTGIQPALFTYDDADRMTTLTTFRAGTETISTDPADRTDGDVTTWTYHDATGLETAKTYADGHGTAKTYDADNRLATLTNARGIVQTNTYDALTGLLTGMAFSDDTTPQSFAYNFLGQLTQVTDAAGTRTFAYNEYGEQTEDSVSVNATAFSVAESRDSIGRSTGYSLKRNAADMQVVSYGYGADGRISSAGFLHGGQEKQFGYSYLQGSELLQTLTMPNNMSLTQSYEPQRDLLTQMAYRRGNTLVAQRTYAYDAAARPTTRSTARQGNTRNDTFTHNSRSELTAATLGADSYAYAYDNIGNRKTAQELAEETTYTANALNQYTAIDDFAPAYDLDGNKTRLKTSTGIWLATYNALNRPVRFESADGSTIITADYDYMGRRVFKKVESVNEVTSSTTSHLRFLYRGYLQIAAIDQTRPTLNAMWYITWDPTQPVATRPLSIQKDGTWYTYGWDLTKNICELYTNDGYIATAYSYTPYGSVTANGYADQPLQWSSEYNDTELGLVYYNYRHYNPVDGRWMGRDIMQEKAALNLYVFAIPLISSDMLGAWCAGHVAPGEYKTYGKGHSDFEGNIPDGPFDYNLEDKDEATKPTNLSATWRHFRPLSDSERDLTEDVKDCNKEGFERHAHQMQDFFAHYGQGYRAEHYHLSRSKTIYNIVAIVNPLNSTYVKSVLWHEIKNLPLGHLVDSINVLGNALPDSAIDYAEAYKQAEERTNMWYTQWKKCCCKKGDTWVRHIDSSGKSACTNFTQPSNPYGETAAPPTFGRRKRFLQELAPNISYPDIKPNQINTRVLKAYKNA